MNYRKALCGVLAIALAAALTRPVHAQRAGRWMWSAKYSTVLGIGDTSDFAGGFSWRGATFDVERGLNENATVGITFGWHVLDEKTAGTEQFDAATISGTAFRYVNSVPLLLTGNFFFGDRGSTRPYIGAGAGTYWIENRTEAGVFLVERSNWHFGLLGEAGIVIPRPGGTSLTLNAAYNWGLEADDIERRYWTFSLGYSVGR